MITECLRPVCDCPPQSPLIVAHTSISHVDLAGKSVEVKWHPTKVVCKICRRMWRLDVKVGERTVHAEPGGETI